MLAGLDHLNVAIDLLFWILLQATFTHFLRIHQKRSLEAKHFEDGALPILFVVVLPDLLDGYQLFFVQIFPKEVLAPTFCN